MIHFLKRKKRKGCPDLGEFLFVRSKWVWSGTSKLKVSLVGKNGTMEEISMIQIKDYFRPIKRIEESASKSDRNILEDHSSKMKTII